MASIKEFQDSTSAANPPAGVGPALEALWWLKRGDWNRAHQCVQGHEGEADCDWVHAHLHRREGDLNNARYWYRRAGKTESDATLADEWSEIAKAMLTRK